MCCSRQHTVSWQISPHVMSFEKYRGLSLELYQRPDYPIAIHLWFIIIYTTSDQSDIPSASISLIIVCTSSCVRFCPSDFIILPNSSVEIVPSPSTSNTLNACQYSTKYLYKSDNRQSGNIQCHIIG